MTPRDTVLQLNPLQWYRSAGSGRCFARLRQWPWLNSIQGQPEAGPRSLSPVCRLVGFGRLSKFINPLDGAWDMPDWAIFLDSFR